MSSFQIGPVTIGGGQLFLIAGPCVIESEEHALKMAEAISAIARQKKLPYIFKASYDKANRTSIRSFRGPGIEEGLRILRKVRETAKVPVLTDVHETADVPRVARSRRRDTDSGVSLPPDRSADCSREERLRGQHQEGPVRLAVGHAARSREGPRRRRRACLPY